MENEGSGSIAVHGVDTSVGIQQFSLSNYSLGFDLDVFKLLPLRKPFINLAHPVAQERCSIIVAAQAPFKACHSLSLFLC